MAGTHTDFDVEIPDVGSMLPEVNANDRDVGEEPVLVGNGGDLEALRTGVQTWCN